MNEVFTALDNINNVKKGENNNLEYDWNNNIIEIQFVELYFQLVRCENPDNLKSLKEKYLKLLSHIFFDYNNNTKNLEYIKLLVKMIANTRDIISGKGEYNLSYLLISELYKFRDNTFVPKHIQELCKSLLTSFVDLPHQHSYGSWKDLKYFLNYHIVESERSEKNIYDKQDELLFHIVSLINNQLRIDNEKLENKTLLSKWIPREKSKKFGWITKILANEYYGWKNSARSIKSNDLAKRKCLTHYRKLLSNNNITLNTPQINQCNHTWRNINFEKDVTSITLKKQSKAFALNNKKGSKNCQNEDRLQCKNNFLSFINNVNAGKVVAKGKRVAIADFVRDAIKLINETDIYNINNQLERDLLNAQWTDNSKNNKTLRDCLAMIDTSYSMHDENCNPLYNAIGLGIRIAEKSKFGKRVLCFSGTPSWINLDSCNNFVEMVEKIRKAPYGTNTNFRNALEKILYSATTSNIHPNSMKDLVLVILSDMQIDEGQGPNDNKIMFDMMTEAYHTAGITSLYQQPYVVPHIVFWNLRKTNGFPNLVTNKNTSMMSGTNPNLINSFSVKGIDALKESTPWLSFVNKLSQDRYNHFDKIINDLF